MSDSLYRSIKVFSLQCPEFQTIHYYHSNYCPINSFVFCDAIVHFYNLMNTCCPTGLVYCEMCVWIYAL
jgi:hypothetical protein